MSLLNLVKEYKPLIDSQTVKVLDWLEVELTKTDITDSKKLKRLLTDYTLGGKSIRGFMFLLTSQMYGQKEILSLLDIASAVEINHSGLLIHDDVMDNDSLRRGRPSIHLQYSKMAKRYKVYDKESFGTNMAICLGDICFFVATYIIENCDLPYSVRSRLASYFHLQLIKTGLSQMADVRCGMALKNPSLKEIIKIYQYKTGNYTFNSPLVLGYLSTGRKDPKEIALLERVGYSLGIIFQITDDLIGFTQDKNITGKDAGSDVRENKKTLIRHYILRELKSSDLKFATHCFGNKKLTFLELKKIRRLFYSKNINEKVNSYLRTEAVKAERSIDLLSVTPEYKEQLKVFVHYLVERNK